MKSFNQASAVIAALLLAAGQLGAATYTVSNTADSGAGSLRQAILNANAGGGGDIVFTTPAGTITLGADLPAISANVNITGPGASLLTVSGSNSFRLFSMQSGTTNTLSNLTVANGWAAQYNYAEGGLPVNTTASGVSNAGSLKVVNCKLVNCSANDGAGGSVYNAGALEMDNCFIANADPLSAQNPRSGVDGGAIDNLGSLIMNSCIVSNCEADLGGGFYNATNGTAVLTGCVIQSCRAYPQFDGGGMVNHGNLTMVSCMLSGNYGCYGGGMRSLGTLTMTNTTVTGNLSGDAGEGGGLDLGGNNLLSGCTISGNSTDINGGGIMNGGYQDGTSTLTMLNCTVSGNVSGFRGGGINNGGLLLMTNCTVSGNATATYNPMPGGGLENSGVIYLTDTTIVSNNATAGAGVDNGGTVYMQDTIIANNTTNDFAGTLTSQGYNLIRSTTGCTLTGNVTGNIYGADPLLGPLQFNGGTTKTHALLAGSPAINAGPANAAPYSDQRGVARPQGPADDIGAFEFGITPSTAPAVLALAASGKGCLQLNLTGAACCTYTLQRSTSLAGPWTPVLPVLAGADGCGGWTELNPGTGNVFYRVSCP